MLQVAAPPGGVLALSQPTGFCGVEDVLDAPAHARGGLGLRRPDRSQDGEHVVGCDLGERLRPQWCGVGRERRSPLRGVLGVAETLGQLRHEAFRERAERDGFCGGRLGAAPLGDRVAPISQGAADLVAFPARVGEGDDACAAEAHLALASAVAKDHQPAPGARGVDDEVEAAAVAAGLASG